MAGPESARPTRDGQNVALVHGQLRDAILSGEIPAGTVASQVTLARDLSVGRTPLREALRMLQREGLVVSEPNRRVHIAELTSDDAEELYVMRIALEAVALRITVPTLTSQRLAELEGLMAQMDHFQRKDDRIGFRVPHQAFHALLVEGAGARVSLQLGELFDHAERYRLAFAFGDPTAERWEQRRLEHRAILDAVAEGDVALAAMRLATHYVSTALAVFETLDPEHDLARLRITLASVAPGSEQALDG
jgi:DNA-binding GntR family transcriptional regulator